MDEVQHALEVTAFAGVREVIRTFPGSYERNAVVWRAVQAYGAVVGDELERLRARVVELTALLNDHDRLMEHACALREFDATAEGDAELERLADGGDV